MSDNKIKEVFNSLHHIDYDEETDDYYIEHLEKIKKLKEESDIRSKKDAPLMSAMAKIMDSKLSSKEIAKKIVDIMNSEEENKKEKE